MKLKSNPYLWSGLVLVSSLALALFIAVQFKVVVEASEITSPDYSLGGVTAYFFGVVAVMALVLFLVPLKRLKIVFRILFAFMFAWGAFILAFVFLPDWAAYAIGVIAGSVWFFWARVWLHDALLLISLASAGAVFGWAFSPLTFMIFMLIIAVYDVLAVRFGFMVWMADKLSGTASLPAFVFPRLTGDWRVKMQQVQFGELQKEEQQKREYVILGGGDIGFPLMLASSILFATNLARAILVGACALVGLWGAFLIQRIWLKGKPMPALPPIAFMCLIGFLVTMYLWK
jgi:presenilin-like A22 family membrane protease